MRAFLDFCCSLETAHAWTRRPFQRKLAVPTFGRGVFVASYLLRAEQATFGFLLAKIKAGPSARGSGGRPSEVKPRCCTNPAALGPPSRSPGRARGRLAGREQDYWGQRAAERPTTATGTPGFAPPRRPLLSPSPPRSLPPSPAGPAPGEREAGCGQGEQARRWGRWRPGAGNRGPPQRPPPRRGPAAPRGPSCPPSGRKPRGGGGPEPLPGRWEGDNGREEGSREAAGPGHRTQGLAKGGKGKRDARKGATTRGGERRGAAAAPPGPGDAPHPTPRAGSGPAEPRGGRAGRPPGSFASAVPAA